MFINNYRKVHHMLLMMITYQLPGLLLILTVIKLKNKSKTSTVLHKKIFMICFQSFVSAKLICTPTNISHIFYSTRSSANFPQLQRV